MKRSLFVVWLFVFSLMTPSLADLAAGSVSHQMILGETLQSLSELYGVDPQKIEKSETGHCWIPPNEDWPTHRVVKGQTLWRIGKAYGISVEQLKQANSLTEASLQPGQFLILPRAEKPVWGLAQKVARGPARQSLSSRSGFRVSPSRNADELRVKLPDGSFAWVPSSELLMSTGNPKQAAELIQVARQFVGVPYKWGGTTPNGYDCSGYVQDVFRLSGYALPRTADVQYERLPKVGRGELQTGDLVFFNTDGSGVSHVGIYTSNGNFLHASSSRGVMESSLEQEYFQSRYLGASRLPAWLVP